MEVNVAGAGAGKTTMMADLITASPIPDGKIVFCIAFTNAAADNITKKVEAKLGEVPGNIKISTIHSFLYREFINPFYHFMYGQQFDQLSVIDLPTEPAYKRAELSELCAKNILHFTEIPEKAKWIIYKKSSDRKKQREARRKILSFFSTYCAAIFVDEAQDINEDIKHIIESLDAAGIRIVLYGDPKQDVKGTGCFRGIIDNIDSVSYISTCHRCPQRHLNLSNTLASEQEKQIADDKNAEGDITIFYESDIDDIEGFLGDGNYGLKYISKKQCRFTTHEKDIDNKRIRRLHHEVYKAMSDKWMSIVSEFEIKRASFYVTEKMLIDFDSGVDPRNIISKYVGQTAFDKLDKKRYAQMISAFRSANVENDNIPVVQSVEIVKGLEAKRCLFILTPDLAPYLFRIKTDDNKTSHLLYVALTRSTDLLTILITKEVETEYTREKIDGFFAKVKSTK